MKLSLKAKNIDYEQEKDEDGILKLFYSIKDEIGQVETTVFTFKPKQVSLYYCSKEEVYRPCSLGELASVAKFYNTLKEKGYQVSQYKFIGNTVYMHSGSEKMVKNYYGFRFNRSGEDCQIVKTYFLNTDKFVLNQQ